MSSPICLTVEPLCVLIIRSEFDAKHFIKYVLLVWDVSSELYNHISISGKLLNPFRDFFKVVTSMDDYYVIVPPDRDAKEIMALIVAKAESLKLTVSKSKSRIVPLTKPFRYCKAKFILTETGRVVMNGNRDGVKRARRKIKAFRTKIQNAS